MPAVELLKRACTENRALFGAHVHIPMAGAIEHCGLLGLSWVLLDTERRSMTPETWRELVCAAQRYGMLCVAQVTHVQRVSIKQFLDAGVRGIVLSKVNSALAVQHLISTIRSTSHELAARDVLTGALIESLEDIDVLEQIIATPGLDCLGIGAGPFSSNQRMVQAGKTQLAVVHSAAQAQAADRNGARLVAVSDDALMAVRSSALLQAYGRR